MAAFEPDGVIDFEVDSEWRKCIYSDYRRGSGSGAPQSSRNNSSTDHSNYIAPNIEPEVLTRCSPIARQNFESLSLVRDAHSISLSLCVRKHNYENYLWQFVHEGVFSGAKAYENLHLWTVLLKVRMHRRVPFGCLVRGLQSRLGLKSAVESLKFCLDGFFGMPGCGDIFGNHGNAAVPWMEVSIQSTADSLQLRDGDVIFVSYANEKLESLAQARKRSLVSRAHRATSHQSAASSMMVSGSNLENISLRGALPLAGVAQPLVLHRARKLQTPPTQHAVAETHSGQPMCIAAETGVSSQFCQAVVNSSDSELDADYTDQFPASVFTDDGAELVPGALERLLGLQSKFGDFFQVRYPDCDPGIGLVMSPEQLTRLLDSADRATVESLEGLTRSRVFRFDASLAPALADDSAAGFGVGVVSELRRFAVELDARLSAQCGEQPGVWRVVSTEYFVGDTFFAAAVASVYGTERDHRFQPYTVDSAMLSIDECFAYTAIDPSAPCEHHLTRAWNLLYLLHPTARELALLEPCSFLRRLGDKFRLADETWKNFVGCSVCSLYEDYNAKKAAFWAINYLVSDRPVYENLLAEIEGAAALKAGGTSSSGSNEFTRLTLSDVEGMQFLEAFVKEIYRHTCGQFIRFRANVNLTLQAQSRSDFNCSKGSQIAVLLRALNMNPKLFQNPEAFCPQRFLSGSADARLLCLPFGAMSPRRRVSLLKLKLFVIQLVTRCSLGQHSSRAAEVNSRSYGVDVLPCVEDVNFQYMSRGAGQSSVAILS